MTRSWRLLLMLISRCTGIGPGHIANSTQREPALKVSPCKEGATEQIAEANLLFP
jgi:hypothetical protein